MAKDLKRLPDAELEIMKVLWAGEGPMTRAQIEQALKKEKQWASTTILGLLARLETKGFVRHTKQGRENLVWAQVSKNEYLPVESGSFLGRMFGGSAKNMIAALHQCDALSQQDMQELTQYLQALQKEQGENT